VHILLHVRDRQNKPILDKSAVTIHAGVQGQTSGSRNQKTDREQQEKIGAFHEALKET
jgi:hypothetical protein